MTLPVDPADLRLRFSNPLPTVEQQQVLAQINGAALNLANLIAAYCHRDRYLFHAMRRLEETVDWARRSILLDPSGPPPVYPDGGLEPPP